ncbi:MAG TPA: PD-(D/E)XK nuclease family protein, partial [Myxococcales bacterium]|nr:PD-(D/E)XK nuclease family protein [Myxococcales bacterium]
VPLRFGKAVHAVLENLVREHMEEEREGPLSEDRAVTLWQEA